jgi:hypothetical protein
MRTQLESRIAARFGVLPNSFRLTTDDPMITENLWGFAQFAYLDNPLPSLLKERLFVYLSLFCESRRCMVQKADNLGRSEYLLGLRDMGLLRQKHEEHGGHDQGYPRECKTSVQTSRPGAYESDQIRSGKS